MNASLNDLVDPNRKAAGSDDMSRPLTSYYINSSHNR